MRQRKMKQQKMKQRKSKQSKSLAKILTLGIAAATVVSSMSVPGGLLAPETVYASDNTGTAESEDQGTAPQEETIQFDVSIRPNDSATVYVMQVTSLADTDRMSYQYSINGTDYYSLQKLQTQETFGASQKVDLHVRAVGSDDTILAAGNREITTPSASDVPTISGTDKFSDRTEVTITAPPGAIIYYTTDGTVPTNGSQQYNAPITLTETTTIQAIAIEDGHIMSDVVGMTFTKESSGGSSSGSNGDDSTLTVTEVVVSVGQQVSEGDPLYLLEEDSVSDLEEELQSNVEKAKADLEAVEADQTLSRQQAKYTYDSSTAYGSYIDTEYSTTLQELQNTVDSAESTLEQAKSSLEDYRAQLEEVTAAYEDAAQVLSNCKYSLNSTDAADDTYGYVYYAQLTEQAQSTADSLEQQKEELEQRVEQAEENVTTAETAYNKAKRELEQGKLTVAETKKLRTLAYNTAQETYDIALGYLAQELSDQQETYNETLEKWNEFSTYIDGNAVCARYNGVITGVELEAGDKISTGTSLVTLYDMDEVTITVTVDEDDMTDISLGSAANIALTAYPEDIFTAKVTAIGDATSDSSGNITYDVTVTLEGDVSGLFQGMTGDVTFVTEQTEEVLYVSRRAIITEDDKTYVKVKTADGSIVKKEITTGLSDDSNVEISGDIAEGDTVLIESSITK